MYHTRPVVYFEPFYTPFIYKAGVSNIPQYTIRRLWYNNISIENTVSSFRLWCYMNSNYIYKLVQLLPHITDNVMTVRQTLRAGLNLNQLSSQFAFKHAIRKQQHKMKWVEKRWCNIPNAKNASFIYFKTYDNS